MLTCLYFSLLFLPFFGFDLDMVCFILSFSCGYYAVSSVFGFCCCDLFSILYILYIYVVCILIRTYADLTFLFLWYTMSPFYFCLRYTICFSYWVYYLLFLFVFLLRGNFTIQSYWSLSCDDELHYIVAMSQRENNTPGTYYTYSVNSYTKK